MEKIGIFEMLGVFLIPVLIVSLLVLISYWKLYEKAGKPGWAVLIPIYSTLVLLEIIRKPWWWLLLMMIPGLNIIWAIWALNLFVKSFGKSEGFTIGCLFLPYVFFPILAFSKDTKYIYDTNEFNSIGTSEV
ncbi:DUF5684 domain-containing protein [Flavobacterium sp. AG291]|uniref:DUF5684 domain-containing protein n=1 Tax=Flavobacterium sp. AG291 TaxID=2184000 RepID=UPI000E0AB6E6|nr:DUF5684 domain-containing protein [Flavobacterium sp. AG291]RDI07981.1 hypothetical protein DEU42_11271 [Flavobacterium sp. AG291]